MVQNTPWCTKEQACHHLEYGDFYVFVDYSNNPHIGIKLVGDGIDEVRGIKNDNAQELEDEYRDVAIEFLSKNKDIRFSKEWLEKEFDTIATRSADPFYISEDTKAQLKEVYKYWRGKTSSDLATSYMTPSALKAIEHKYLRAYN